MPNTTRIPPNVINIPIASGTNNDKSPIHTPNMVSMIPLQKLLIIVKF